MHTSHSDEESYSTYQQNYKDKLIYNILEDSNNKQLDTTTIPSCT